MAKVPLTPIGRPLDSFLEAVEVEHHRAGSAKGERVLAERRAAVQAGWGEEYVARVHKKDKLTTRERIELLKDDASEIFEVGTFVNWGRRFGKTESPAAGVVTAFVQVHERWTMVIANDNTVATGSWWPQTAGSSD